MSRKTIAQTLEEQRVLIFNSKKPEIATQLEAMGLGADYLSQGENLFNEIMSLREIKNKEQQEESLAYDNYYELMTECKTVAKQNFKIIKMATRANKDLQARLKIYSPISRRVEKWILQTTEFNNHVLNEPELLEDISKFKITPEKLQQNQSALEQLKSLRNEAIAEKGQTQEATRLRNAKMVELEDYCYELKTIASIALEEQPQLLEMLGILVRS